jgi:hypothetical protein
MIKQPSVHHGVELQQELVTFATDSYTAYTTDWAQSNFNKLNTTLQDDALLSRQGSSTSTASDATTASATSSNTDAGSSSSSSSSSSWSNEAMETDDDDELSLATSTSWAPAHGGASQLLQVDVQPAETTVTVETAGSVTATSVTATGVTVSSPFAEVTFVHGNVFEVDAAVCMKYDRIYVGAACPAARRKVCIYTTMKYTLHIFCDCLHVLAVAVHTFKMTDCTS